MATDNTTTGNTTIWWDSYCGHNNIYDAFWDIDLTWNTFTPDLTVCFQKTVISLVSCALLWLPGLVYIPSMHHSISKHSWRDLSYFNVTKLVLIAGLVALSGADLVYYISYECRSQCVTVATAHYVEAALLMATYLLSAWLTYWEFIKGIHSSGVMFVFWFVRLLASIVSLRSEVMRAEAKQEYGFDQFLYVTTATSFSLVALLFIAQFFADTRALRPVRVCLDASRGRQNLFRGRPDERTPLLGKEDIKVEPTTTPSVTSDSVADESHPEPCPMTSASIVSKVFFGWYTPLVIKGYRRQLEFGNIWALREQDSSDYIVPKFLGNLGQKNIKHTPSSNRQPTSRDSKQQGNATFKFTDDAAQMTDSQQQPSESSTELPTVVTKSPSDSALPDENSLWRTVIKTFGWQMMWPGFIILMTEMVPFVQPYVMRAIIDFVETGDPYVWRGYVYVAAMFVLVIVFDVLMNQHFFHLMLCLGMRLRTALTAVIYRKAMRLSNIARKDTTIGEIVNLMSVDVQKLQDFPVYLHFLWIDPLAVVVGTVLLWQVLGPSCLAGIGFMLVILPLNSFFVGKKVKDLQEKQMALKDQRIKLMNQMLNGIKVLKIYAWEPYFQDKVRDLREKEVKAIRHQAYLLAILHVIWTCSPFIMTMLCFMTYVLVSPENVLDPQTAFVSLSLINVTAIPFAVIPHEIIFCVQAAVSFKRLDKFLRQPEVDPDNVCVNPITDQATAQAVEITDGTFSWGKEDNLTLKSIDLRVPRGSLVAVVGSVGSGKSSLVSALLGEMVKHSGSVIINGMTAYVPQQAWIQNMTVKDNVLFSRPYNQVSYDCVLEACAMTHDLSILPAGDQTEIGEKGINLSGGQKQRVSLARAVYQDCDIYLLDDPLSAVDAHVGKHIFSKVIGKDGLLKDKTRVLVTHGVSFLPEVDQIVVLKDGVITEQGTYDQLLSHQGAFADFIAQYLASGEDSMDGELDLEEANKLKRRISELTKSGSHLSVHSGSDITSSGKLRHRKRKDTVKSQLSVQDENLMLKKQLSQQKDKLIEDEGAELGNISWSVTKSYMRAASYRTMGLLLVSYVGFIVAQVLTNIWLSEWTSDPVVNGTQDSSLLGLRLGVYGGLGVIQTLMMLGLGILMAVGTMSASVLLHTSLLDNILRCPMAFFDTTPIGRIINRFSKDIETCDFNIPRAFLMTLTSSAPTFTTIIVISYSTPIFIVALIPMVILFLVLQRLFLATGRQVTRLDSVRRSPLYAYFSESLMGVTSIRAYKQQSRFIQHNDVLLDESQRAYFANFTSHRWLGIYAQSIAGFIVMFAGLFAVLQRDTVSPALVGLSVSFSLQISFSLVWALRNACELETFMVAVERINEYTEVETEAAWVNEDHKPPRDWPHDGDVEFKQYATRYRKGLDLVLRDITCHINSGETVGIVGRTGAGKSSLALALFRIIESTRGSIHIDGEDISVLGLHQLRSKLTIIPQDPVLFSGSLRFNIDPSSSYTDDEVWFALEHAHLKGFVTGLTEGLNHECGEDGGNLSVGQRQLLCLARALLRESKVLVLDEATAAVDLETDDLIQQTIRERFSGCTVLTIAHRLQTVLDYNRVMVISEGRILELDSPDKLLDDKTTTFYSMAKDAGVV